MVEGGVKKPWWRLDLLIFNGLEPVKSEAWIGASKKKPS